jgi:CRISPR/Cas system CSM-associated protein Csm2 small subunit
MKSEYFWGLSLYDWSIWIDRILSQQQKRKEDHELMILLARNSDALFANANFKKENGEQFDGRDFYKLSYDEIKENSDRAEKITGKILFEQMQERFKGKPLRNGRNSTG